MKPVVLPKIALLSVVLFGMVACAKQADFQKQVYSSQAVAAQYTKPKIDILFVQDDSSSMAVPMANIQSQLNSFLSNMSGQWDYHFTVVPLQSVLSLNSKWIVAQDCTTINSQYCIPASSASTFNSAPAGTTYGWINTTDTSTANTDLGFQNIQANLAQSSMTTTNFLRPDAALAVVVLSNGDDATGLDSTKKGNCLTNNTYSPQNFPQYDYCNYEGTGQYEMNPYSTDAINSFNSFRSYLTGLKGNSGLTKFYSVVANNNYLSDNCYGGNAWLGDRYMSMSIDPALASSYFNICDGTGLPSVLNSISTNLQSLVQAYMFNYAVLAGQPVVSSIVVTKNGVTIPQDPTNGWTYEGYLTNQYISYSPTPSNLESGYMIKLNGTAVYSGSDVINVSFQQQ